ncbi:MAG: glycosyltransferase [Cyanobacteria bacterium P01_A01_bin.135]
MQVIFTALAALPLLIWLYLLLARGGFWQPQPQLEVTATALPPLSGAASDKPPRVQVVIPARNEADALPHSLPSLLGQDYPGELSILLVDDHSTDGTAAIAQGCAEASAIPLTVLPAAPLPPGWTGKLWALHQGSEHVLADEAHPQDYLLFTDADICHSPQSIGQLVTLAESRRLQMASVMVRLRCESAWERLLIPAFVFFFQKLYPFRWSNNPQRRTAAAAGGCVLLRREALQRIGGVAAIRDALIDDCALAAAVKHTGADDPPFYPIWLGLSNRIVSLRPYPSLQSIWDMVARTAYTQLHYSPLLLLGSVLGMGLVYLSSPFSLIVGLLTGQWLLALLGLLGWGMMTLAYWPMVRFYHCAPGYAAALPTIALLYMLMTLDSARRHWQGAGGAWKGRTYGAEETEGSDATAKS